MLQLPPTKQWRFVALAGADNDLALVGGHVDALAFLMALRVRWNTDHRAVTRPAPVNYRLPLRVFPSTEVVIRTNDARTSWVDEDSLPLPGRQGGNLRREFVDRLCGRRGRLDCHPLRPMLSEFLGHTYKYATEPVSVSITIDPQRAQRPGILERP